MKESLASRVSRILSGSINQLVEAFENAAPEAVMSQAIREVEGAMDEARDKLGKVIANHHLAAQRLIKLQGRHRDLQDKINLALKEDRQDLAEAAVAALLDLEAQLPVLETALQEQADERKELDGFVAALKARKREMEEELDQFRKSRRESQSSEGDAPAGSSDSDLSRRLSKAESAFERVYKDQTGLDGGAQDMDTSAKLQELEDIARKNRIAERLAQIKARQEQD